MLVLLKRITRFTWLITQIFSALPKYMFDHLHFMGMFDYLYFMDMFDYLYFFGMFDYLHFMGFVILVYMTSWSPIVHIGQMWYCGFPTWL